MNPPRHVARHVDPLLTIRERAPEATPLADGAAGRPLCADEEAERGPDTSPVVGRPAILSRERDRVRIGEPFEPAGNLDACLLFGPARHTIVEAALDDSVMELEEEGADEILNEASSLCCRRMPSVICVSRRTVSGRRERASARARKALWAIDEGSPRGATMA